jgi:hypothetical protein
MDPNQGNSQVNGTQPPYAQPPYGQPPYAQPPYAQPPYAQPPYAQPPQGTVVPMDGGWAPGVYPVPVSPRSHRLRWTAAGAVVLCVAIVTAAAAFVLSGAAGAKSLTSSVAPKDTIAFLEVRTDLPGDQRAKLADFMSHFPGFQDRAQFDTALDEMLNRLTSSVSPDLAYTSAFKPWMEGEVSIAEMGPGTGAALTGSAVGSVSLPSTVAIFALKDRAAAQTWVNSELDRLKLAASPQDYAGTKLYTAGVGIGAEGAYAFTDQDLLVGTVDGVKAALDSKTKGSLTDNPDYQAAMKSFSGDSLARFYLAARALVASELDSLNAAMQQLSSAASAPIPTLGISSATTPAWIAGSVRSESDRMVVDVAYPSPNDTSSGNHASRLANALPGSTVGAVEVHSLGKLLTDGLAAAEAGLPGNSTLGNVKTVLGLMGGLDWIGDGVAAVTKDGSNFSEGFVVQATDASTAGSKVALISNAVCRLDLWAQEPRRAIQGCDHHPDRRSGKRPRNAARDRRRGQGRSGRGRLRRRVRKGRHRYHLVHLTGFAAGLLGRHGRGRLEQRGVDLRQRPGPGRPDRSSRPFEVGIGLGSGLQALLRPPRLGCRIRGRWQYGYPAARDHGQIARRATRRACIQEEQARTWQFEFASVASGPQSNRPTASSSWMAGAPATAAPSRRSATTTPGRILSSSPSTPTR